MPVVVTMWACPKVAPPAPGPTAGGPVKIPPGCAQTLEGPWRHADDPSWRYLAFDDGGSVTLEVRREFPLDAGPERHRGATPGGGPDAGRADAGPGTAPHAVMTVFRGAQGFSGQLVGEVEHPSGVLCPLELPVEITACGPSTLTLRSPASTTLGDRCQSPEKGRPGPWLEHHLTRLDAGG